jgi:hypothetical protein
MYRPPARTPHPFRLIAHFISCWPETRTTANTYEIALQEAEWRGMDALIAVADFWNLKQDNRSGLDGEWYSLEAWKTNRVHTVCRWSSGAFPAGELFAVVTDYMRRLAELAEFEWFDDELYLRYGLDYKPKRRILKTAR